MAKLEKISRIKRETLSGEHYFQSLLEQGYLAQVLSEVELEEIQLHCLALLAKKTERYNGGESSSISIEKAQDLLASMVFTLGVQLKIHQNPDDAVAAVQREGVETICAAGRKRIDRLIKQAKLRHAALTGQLLQTENVFYSATIVDGIRGFFQLYDADFAAHENIITADYPVYNRTKPLLGIEMIGQYLEQLYYENLFCVHFPSQEIHHLLCGYEEDYENLLFNLYEPVLAAALGCALSGLGAGRLGITPAAQVFLCRQFDGKKQDEIEQMLTVALLEVSSHFSFSDGLFAYATQSLPQLAETIENSQNLNRIFIVPQDPMDHAKVLVSYGEKMEDALYREVLTAFMDCESTEKRIETIQQQIHSFADLEDLLLDSELFEEDLLAILQQLHPGELAAFYKKYLACPEWERSDFRSCEVVFSSCLTQAISMLSPQQQAWIKEASKAIRMIE